MKRIKLHLPDSDPTETGEWLDALHSVVEWQGPHRAEYLLRSLLTAARSYRHLRIPGLVQTPYINTIIPEEEPAYPGDEELELKIRRIIRWNAVAMVMRGNRLSPGLGGHLASYASSASLLEVGFNHFFRGKDHPGGGDQVYFQGHAAPGIYSRAFLEGRLSQERLEKFRRELPFGAGLSSYPHPRLMPDFWEFPTVSMGLGPISALYQARFNRYLQARGIANTEQQKVWCFIGDGETDEVETIGAIDLATRENLSNLVFVVNCNLQRLDGPVRGNGKIVQELEGQFRGLGWKVIKVLWGRGWDKLLARDHDGLLKDALGKIVDGQMQRHSIQGPEKLREEFFGQDPRLLKMVEDLSDHDLRKLRRGGHDYHKIYAAYKMAAENDSRPTVILAQTVKGWTLGDSIMASNITHQQKKMSEEELKTFRDLLELPIADKDLAEEPPFYHPGPDSPEVRYLLERRRQLGGFLPERRTQCAVPDLPKADWKEEFFQGSRPDQPVSTTMVFVRALTLLMRQPELGRRIVPIVPDEARTFGMHTLFPEFGIYAPGGQKYEPVDQDKMLFYREAADGQILEEGITEAGSMAGFQAAATSYATHGEAMIPFYVFYSMFGFQRTADQGWQLGDVRARGFLIGATAGRTTLNGEGLQHQDGQSPVYASLNPAVRVYDPAFAFELALIIDFGLERMVRDQNDELFYLTVYNENYPQWPAPEHLTREELTTGVRRGMYLLKDYQPEGEERATVVLMAAGVSVPAAARAAENLSQNYGVRTRLFSVPAFVELRRELEELEQKALDQGNPAGRRDTLKGAWLYQCLADSPEDSPVVAVSDYSRQVPDSIARWLPGRLHPLGTDGFGFSETRENLRDFFGVSSRHIARQAMFALAEKGQIGEKVFQDFQAIFEIKNH